MPKRKLSGIVSSDKQDKTIVVMVTRQVQHPKYKKIIRRSKKYSVHDEKNKFKKGDAVSIEECKPYSKTKTWVVIDSNKNLKEQKAQLEDRK